MAKVNKMLTLTQDAIDEAEALSANDTHRYSVSSMIEALIHEAYAKRADHLKRIEPIRDGKKIIGWGAHYGMHLVGTFDGAASKPEAERALDAYVYEELSR